ncbi:MAG TPA: YceI family protein [Rhodocyclaceae bacterium]|nr:YceI family protein [Rhodocyclaceae bacterium]
MKKFVAILLLGTLSLMQVPVRAAEFNTVQIDKSRLDFAYRQMGVPMNGNFRKFSLQMGFDPAKPQAASAVMEVDLSSIDTGSAEADDEVKGKLWFDTRTYPTARFVVTGIKPLGGDRYEVAGKFTLKGRTQDLRAAATFRQEGAFGVFDGSLTFKRADFAIGEGAWADFGTVANEIQVRFHIVATRAATKKK